MTNNNEELIKVLKQSEKEALSLKNEFVGTETHIVSIYRKFHVRFFAHVFNISDGLADYCIRKAS